MTHSIAFHLNTALLTPSAHQKSYSGGSSDDNCVLLFCAGYMAAAMMQTTTCLAEPCTGYDSTLSYR